MPSRFQVLTAGMGACLIAFGLRPGAPVAAQAASAGSDAQAQLIDKICTQEKKFEQRVMKFSPRVETYVQQLRPDAELGEVPAHDNYFLGRLDWQSGMKNGVNEPLFQGAGDKYASWPLESLFKTHFYPRGFASMIMPDETRFDQQHYTFAFQGREFLGDVRCLMFDVTPRAHTADGSFLGRIWVEDQGDNIVRFDGTFVPNKDSHYVHFDSWRMNLAATPDPDSWLPAAVYSQENDIEKTFGKPTSFKAETRFWGYKLGSSQPAGDLTDVQVESPAAVDDQSQTAHELSPLGDQRAWEQKAEDDVLTRMEKAGLLAPPGEVDKVLSTVVNNLEVTNNLSFDPEVRCRVMLTSPLESFTVGHTIVVSRGLIDVLPDEASLAMVIAHELGHIALDHGINTNYAFDDRMMFADEQTFSQLQLSRSPAEEAAADEKGLALLKKSPYADKLSQAGLFLEALARESNGLPNLLNAHLGNQIVLNGRVHRMQALLASAPQLQVRNTQQIAALPLGARISLDPWSDKLTLLKAKPEAILAPRDKLSFEVTPYMPYLTRLGSTTDMAAKSPASRP